MENFIDFEDFDKPVKHIFNPLSISRIKKKKSINKELRLTKTKTEFHDSIWAGFMPFQGI